MQQGNPQVVGSSASARSSRLLSQGLGNLHQKEVKESRRQNMMMNSQNTIKKKGKRKRRYQPNFILNIVWNASHI